MDVINRCSDDESEMDISLQYSEPTDLATLNDYCFRHIFNFMDWTDIINLADTCQQLRTVVCGIFQRKIANTKIHIGRWKHDSFSPMWMRMQYQDNIFIVTPMMAFKFLRIFGHLVGDMHIDFTMFYRRLYKIALEYLAAYGSESFIRLSLLNNEGMFPFPEYFSAIPFTSVTFLQIENFWFIYEMPISKFFPNVDTLKLGGNVYEKTSALTAVLHKNNVSQFKGLKPCNAFLMERFETLLKSIRCFCVTRQLRTLHVPSVKHLFFYGFSSVYHFEVEFGTDDLLALLKLNPQLEALDLQLIDARRTLHWHPKIIDNIKELFPNLKRLMFKVPFEPIYFNEFTPIHFDHIEHFSYRNSIEFIPFSFSKLKYLELQSDLIGLTYPPLRELIDKSQCLTSISIQCYKLNYVESFFEFKNVLTNIEELSIGLIHDVRWECVLQFLQQSRSLRTFSMIGTKSNFYDFASKMIAQNRKPTIRNRNFEFTIQRESDGLSTKYAIKHLNWSSFQSSLIKPIKQQLMQFCTYKELSLTTYKENIGFIKLLKKIGNFYYIEFEKHINTRTPLPAIMDVIRTYIQPMIVS